MIIISAVTGTCFATLAGLSIIAVAVPVRRFHAFSIILAAVSIYFAYLAFRAAIWGQTDEETLAKSLVRGIVGALLGLIIGLALLTMLRPGIQGFFAHAINKPSSSFSIFRFVVASVLLGFGAGFVLRVPRARAELANSNGR
jgi:hypothetical protein